MATAIQNQPVVGPRVGPLSRIPRDVRAAMDGMAAGIVATVPMSAAMLAARRLGLMGRQPPERITQKVFFRGRRRVRSRMARSVVSSALHFAFGGVGGAVYAVAQRRLASRATSVLTGAVYGAGYGTLVWAGSYMGWIPALGLMPPPHRDRPDRPVVMVVAHWIFGATLGAVVGWLGRVAPGGSERPSWLSGPYSAPLALAANPSKTA